MDIKLQEMTQKFSKIMEMEEISRRSCILIEGKIKILKEYYLSMGDYLITTDYVFGLDSFRFQTRIIDLEYDDIQRLYTAYINRMYGEYFKLYKIIEKSIHNINNRKLISISKANQGFPIYQDLEPFKKYDYKVITNIHEVILILINSIIGYHEDKIQEMEFQQQKQNIGLNINNFIHSFSYDNTILENKINLFINYLSFFHTVHTKYMKRFISKINLFISQLNHDIIFDDSMKSINIRRKSILETFKDDKINENLINDIKETMTGESSKDNTSDSSNCNSPFIKSYNSIKNIFLPMDTPSVSPPSSESPSENESNNNITLDIPNDTMNIDDQLLKNVNEYIKVNTPPSTKKSYNTANEEIISYLKTLHN